MEEELLDLNVFRENKPMQKIEGSHIMGLGVMSGDVTRHQHQLLLGIGLAEEHVLAL